MSDWYRLWMRDGRLFHGKNDGGEISSRVENNPFGVLNQIGPAL